MAVRDSGSVPRTGYGGLSVAEAEVLGGSDRVLGVQPLPATATVFRQQVRQHAAARPWQEEEEA